MATFVHKNWEKIALILIIFSAFLVRFINLASYPAGFHADEASFGYDAYSILKTGRDQWGNFLPISFKSFGDYKTPLYGYIDIIFVAIFGLSKFATRLPGPIIGIFSVLAIYLLICEVLKSKKIALVGAFALAFNPWSIMLSRGAFESNLITLMIPLGIYFFIKGLKSEKFLIWSSIFFGLGLFSYHSAKLVVPLVIFGLAVIFRKNLRRIGLKKLIASCSILLVFFVGIAYTIVLGGGTRVAERSITQGALEEGAKEKIAAISSGVNPTLAKLQHNKYQVVASRFINNYLQYLSPKFLFTGGAGEATYGMIPGIGVLNIYEGILLIGLVPFFFKKSKRLVVIFLLWVFVGILPAALSTGVGFAGNRASGMMPALQVLESFGFLGLAIFLSKNKYLIILPSFLLAALAVFNIYTFINKYFFEVPESFYGGMLYGDLEVGTWLGDNAKGKSVIVSRSLSEPQIFIAFGQKWNPVGYQWASKAWDLAGYSVPWVDQLPEYRLENYVFKSIDWKAEINDENTILIGRPDDFPKNLKPSEIIYDPAGVAQIYVKIN